MKLSASAKRIAEAMLAKIMGKILDDRDCFWDDRSIRDTGLNTAHECLKAARAFDAACKGEEVQ